MAGKFDPKTSGYVEVKDRITEFYNKFPNGSIQSEVVELNDAIVVMKAYAYRNPEDPRPGIGHSQMPIPGLTPYTINSEVENAETSAWGRAIAALGFEVKRSIATSDEIEMKGGSVSKDPTDPGTASDSSATTAFAPPASEKATPAQKARMMAQGKRLFGSVDGVKKFVSDLTGISEAKNLTKTNMQVIFAKMDALESLGMDPPELYDDADEDDTVDVSE